MKKIVSLLLIVALTLTLGITAVAADATLGQGGNKEIDVTAKYESSSSTPAVYSVDISWSNMVFVYTQESTKNWNATTHSYETVSQGDWDHTTATITITNHSNVAVDVNVEYMAVDGTGVTGTMSNASDTLAAGEENNYDGAAAMTATLAISGTPSDAVSANGVKIGTLKITLD